ncbi:alpha/beta fold hydrolase [Microbacterium sp. TNHR37B]|uniref:alpha/beta fold hydrolase n=1 Tax=Microbacterium sp. TNHR37B TaxID=1775956 RepID=UPI0007B30D0E|nr:alpha/beta hydrolase [Microbacterium sp. TNHR37B]KZE88961.1 2-(acetamidomethylene)succinate hydrolase [Microbacterium sp. TNHR37B]
MDDASDEFRFLPGQAADLDVEVVPPVSRLTSTLPDGRKVSGLRFGEGPPVAVFLHGGGLNAHTWDTTILATGLPAIAVDLPGHGDSSWRDDENYTGASLAEDVAPAIREWTGSPFVLVGHSLGGLTAAALAAHHPDLVRALIVVDITPGMDPDGGAAQIRAFFAGPIDWASREELVERALAFGLGGNRAAAARGVFLNSRVRADGRVEWKHHYARIANRLAADSAAADEAQEKQGAMRDALASSGWKDLAAVAAPLTLVRGARGFLTDADVAEFRRRVPEATVIELDSGHNVHEQMPAALARIIVDVAHGDDE